MSLSNFRGMDSALPETEGRPKYNYFRPDQKVNNLSKQSSNASELSIEGQARSNSKPPNRRVNGIKKVFSLFGRRKFGSTTEFRSPENGSSEIPTSHSEKNPTAQKVSTMDLSLSSESVSEDEEAAADPSEIADTQFEILPSKRRFRRQSLEQLDHKAAAAAELALHERRHHRKSVEIVSAKSGQLKPREIFPETKPEIETQAKEGKSIYRSFLNQKPPSNARRRSLESHEKARPAASSTAAKANIQEKPKDKDAGFGRIMSAKSGVDLTDEEIASTISFGKYFEKNSGPAKESLTPRLVDKKLEVKTVSKKDAPSEGKGSAWLGKLLRRRSSMETPRINTFKMEVSRDGTNDSSQQGVPRVNRRSSADFSAASLRKGEQGVTPQRMGTEFSVPAGKGRAVEEKPRPENGRKSRRWSISSMIHRGNFEIEAMSKPEKARMGPGSAQSNVVYHMVNVLRRPLSDIRHDYDVLTDIELGRGKYGVIYKCVMKKNGFEYACKVINKEKLTRWQHIEAVRMEVDILESLRGEKHIINLKDSYEDAEAIYFVMDLCKGGELFERVQKYGKYSEDEAAEVCQTLAQVLACLNERGIVHRDLKPENILLTRKDRPTAVKVIDFGLATFWKQLEEQPEIVGTPNYCAPESLQSGICGPESDMWSLGIVLYIILSGIPPFVANTVEEIYKTIIGDFLDLDEGLWLDVSPDARELIRRMLRVEPAERIKPHEVLIHPWVMRKTLRKLDKFTKPAKFQAEAFREGKEFDGKDFQSFHR